MLKPRFFMLVGMVVSAGFLRLVPHPWNVTPVAAMALFAGAHFDDKRLSFLVPLLAVFLSDLFIAGFYPGWWMVYVAHISVVMVGFSLRQNRSVGRVALGTLAGSVSFFLISNLSYFLVSPLYAKSFAGLMQCYTAAIPFFRNTMVGDLFFAALLFGSFHLAERRFPVLRPAVSGVR